MRSFGEASGSFERLLDLLLELVETHAEWLAGLGGSGLEPGVGDELEAALFAAEPVEAEGFLCVGGGEGGGARTNFVREGGEGGIERGFIIRGEVRDVVSHGCFSD